MHHFWDSVALIYAALEGTSEITVDQLVAAISFAEYQRDAQRYVLGEERLHRFWRTQLECCEELAPPTEQEPREERRQRPALAKDAGAGAAASTTAHGGSTAAPPPARPERELRS